MRRRDFLRTALLAASAGTLTSGCSGAALTAAAGSGTALKFWNLFAGGDGARLVRLQEAFSKAHPEIDLEAVTLSWGPPYYTKLSMAAAGGRAPDLAVLHLSRLAGFAPGRLLDPVPLGMLREVGINESQLNPKLWERAMHKGQQFAVPLDTHPFVMYYNTDFCDKAGLLDGDGKLPHLEGEDAVASAFHAVKSEVGGHPIVIEGTGVGPWRQWWSLYRQLGGQLLDDSATSLAVDREKGIRALTFLRRLVEEELAPANLIDDAAVAMFGGGDAAFLWHGEWEVTTFLEQNTPFGMARFPAVFGNGRAQADSHAFVLPYQRDRDPARTRAALTFVGFMLEHSLEWAKGGHIPAYQPVLDSEAYRKLDPQSEYRGVADDVQLDPPAWFSGSASMLETEAGAAFGAVLAGQLSPEDGLDQFTAAVQSFLDTPEPV